MHRSTTATTSSSTIAISASGSDCGDRPEGGQAGVVDQDRRRSGPRPRAGRAARRGRRGRSGRPRAPRRAPRLAAQLRRPAPRACRAERATRVTPWPRRARCAGDLGADAGGGPGDDGGAVGGGCGRAMGASATARVVRDLVLDLRPGIRVRVGRPDPGGHLGNLGTYSEESRVSALRGSHGHRRRVRHSAWSPPSRPPPVPPPSAAVPRPSAPSRADRSGRTDRETKTMPPSAQRQPQPPERRGRTPRIIEPPAPAPGRRRPLRRPRRRPGGLQRLVALRRDQLREAGYTPRRQYFPFTYTRVLANKVIVDGADMRQRRPHRLDRARPTAASPPSWSHRPTVGLHRRGLGRHRRRPARSRWSTAAPARSPRSRRRAKAAGAVGVVIWNNVRGAVHRRHAGRVDPDLAPTTGIDQAAGQALVAAAGRRTRSRRRSTSTSWSSSAAPGTSSPRPSAAAPTTS